jgi:NAD(P)-dependent dehydrogenase (short-subunit alcohol dehydrogenase family)
MTEHLKGRVALVTGGGSGLGRASALAFAREGARVVVADVVAEGGSATVQMIEKAGGEAVFVKADVSNSTEVEALMVKAIKTYGQIDCAHNNAGIEDTTGSIIECTEEDWDRLININLKSVWLCMKYEIIHMIKRGGGAIVNTSSVAGLVASPTGPVYTATKHGVLGLTKAAALGYAKAGIRINAVCPGPIYTPLLERITRGNTQLESAYIERVPMGRIGTPPEVAEAVVWLCSDAASFITGHAMVVDGGVVTQ